MKCGFCGKEIERGTGKIYIYGEKKIPFCSRKCETNLINFKRNPKKVKWVTKKKK